MKDTCWRLVTKETREQKRTDQLLRKAEEREGDCVVTCSHCKTTKLLTETLDGSDKWNIYQGHPYCAPCVRRRTELLGNMSGKNSWREYRKTKGPPSYEDTLRLQDPAVAKFYGILPMQ